MPDSIVTNEDCMELMLRYEDKYFDLAVVDPPYGIGATIEIGLGDRRSGRVNRPSKWGQKEWDTERPSKEYFEELIRVSKNQIIFGGNYFADLLKPSRCWLVWDKMSRIDQADAELAWTSFKTSVRIYQFHCSKLKGFLNSSRFHPTEKPIALYDWIFLNYAKQGDKIIDTHLGSGSSRIAAYKCGLDFVGCELDKEYFDKQEKRFEAFTSQLTLF
jgi:site-specific DNA-methyltransferase (adenine-specific)